MKNLPYHAERPGRWAEGLTVESGHVSSCTLAAPLVACAPGDDRNLRFLLNSFS